MREKLSEGPRNSNKPRRHQFPQPNNMAAGFSGQDMRPTDLDTDTFAVHGENAQDKLSIRDHHTVPVEDVRSSHESLPVSSVQSPASCGKIDKTTNGSGTYCLCGKSLAQLRVQAQGAEVRLCHLLVVQPGNIIKVMARSRAAIVGSCKSPLLSPGSRDSSGPDTKRIELAARRERATRPMHPEQVLTPFDYLPGL
ncbi:hypothetical protein ACJ73_03223 [Blastomyces percursus]|uniref:Uncharacterized protein n=1 Tax=Blastomyces percursus TaxID=1658174 RepID=A0A1J9QZ14_9EURO|nr:hypothetical protein ACJ73_03223 [Blastomyces percursus]